MLLLLLLPPEWPLNVNSDRERGDAAGPDGEVDAELGLEDAPAAAVVVTSGRHSCDLLDFRVGPLGVGDGVCARPSGCTHESRHSAVSSVSNRLCSSSAEARILPKPHKSIAIAR